MPVKICIYGAGRKLLIDGEEQIFHPKTTNDVIVTPHVAWASEEAMRTLWAQLIGPAENFRAGRPSNVVI